MKTALVVAPMLFRRCPLIGMGYLAAYLRARGHEVAAFDTNVLGPIPCDDNETIWQDEAFARRYVEENRATVEGWCDRILEGAPGVVGFSLWHSTEKVTMAMARMIKARDPRCVIVLGGPHVNFHRERLLMHNPAVDYLVRGEGEQALLEIVEKTARGERSGECAGTFYRRGREVRCAAARPEIADLDSIPDPDFSDFPLERYYLKTTLPISFNRGCIRHCEFCNVHADWDSYRHRKAPAIFGELKRQLERYPAVTHFEIDVAALNQNIKQLDELCDLIIADGLRIGWGGQALLRPEMSGQFILKMAKAGCRNLNYGLEYGSQEIINKMKKGFVLEQAARCIHDAHEAGIEVSLNIILGFPGETDDDIDATMRFLKENKASIDFVGFPSELTLNDGTPMHQHPERFGIVPGPTASGVSWTAPGSDHETRQARIKRFNQFLVDEGIGEFGPYSRVKTVTEHQMTDEVPYCR